MPPLRLLSDMLLDLNTSVIINRESRTKIWLNEPESSINLVASLPTIPTFRCICLYTILK